MVTWIIGLSGAGKTTLAEHVAARLRRRGVTVALVDGDGVRSLFENDLGHSLEDRRRNAWRIVRLCKFLDEQGIDVVCAILSLFPETREWCRENMSDYYEVFIDAPLETLVERDDKGLYRGAREGRIENVAGMDIPFTPPQAADLVIRNTGRKEELVAHAAAIASRYGERSK